ncbi:MAG: SufE family protein [Bdellovibrionaceae bacterium]|nr:SufE family protein [Pseudobdellovibrionaceae bacterium]
MLKTLDPQQKIINSFRNYESWEDKYKHIIQLGKTLTPLQEKLKTEDNIVKGCQSQVWLVASINSQNKIEFKGDSDAIIVKGLLALVLSVYNGLSASEVLATEPLFLKKLQLSEHLSPSRSNGLFAMIKKIKYYGLAFQALERQN